MATKQEMEDIIEKMRAEFQQKIQELQQKIQELQQENQQKNQEQQEPIQELQQKLSLQTDSELGMTLPLFVCSLPSETSKKDETHTIFHQLTSAGRPNSWLLCCPQLFHRLPDGRKTKCQK